MTRRQQAKTNRTNRTESIPIRFTPAEKLTVNRVAIERHDCASTYLRRLILQHLDGIMKKEVPSQTG